MHYFSSFAIGGFVPSAAVAGVLLLVGLGLLYLGIKVLQIIKTLIKSAYLVFITLLIQLFEYGFAIILFILSYHSFY